MATSKPRQIAVPERLDVAEATFEAWAEIIRFLNSMEKS
jgi:hypothetical protein